MQLLNKIFFIFLSICFLSTNVIANQKQDLEVFIHKLFEEHMVREIKQAAGMGIIEDNLPNDRINNLKSVEIPKKDMPDQELANKLESEDPEEFYYGYNEAPDYEKARLIAYANLRKMSIEGYDEIFPSTIIGPISVLMMVYTNGQEVERNFDLGMKLAVICNWAPGELEKRIKRIVKLKSINWQGNDFLLCDNITSGFMSGYCSDIRSKIQDGQRKKKFANITKNWTQAERDKFKKLQKIAEDFFNERASAEIDYQGTAAASFIIEEEREQKKSFQELIEQLEQNIVQSVSHVDFELSDKKLNEIYRHLMNRISEKIEDTTIKKSDIKNAQRNWIKYRDGFVSFVEVRYPHISKDTICKILTDIRIAQLKVLMRFADESWIE